MAVKKRITRVVIAAAGQGIRMLPLTKNKPKPLINILKKPFLSYLLDNILKAGYKELIVVVGYKAEMMEKFLKEYSAKKLKGKKGYKITSVNQFKILGQKEYGTACPLKCVRDFIGSDDFLMVCGDNLYSARDLKAFNIPGKYNYIAGVHHQHPEKYGVLIVENGFLKRNIEKPRLKRGSPGAAKKYVGNLINAGLYKFTPEVFEKLSKIKKSARGEYELTDVVGLLAKEKKVKVKEIQDYWMDFGKPSDIVKLSKFFKKKKF
jgi:NDP-sugar pyrophosphorylase family protein